MHQHVGGEGAGEEGVVVAAGLPPPLERGMDPGMERNFSRVRAHVIGTRP